MVYRSDVKYSSNLANVYLSKINNRNTRKSCELCLKLIINIPEQRYCFGVFLVNFRAALSRHEPVASFIS